MRVIWQALVISTFLLAFMLAQGRADDTTLERLQKVEDEQQALAIVNEFLTAGTEVPSEILDTYIRKEFYEAAELLIREEFLKKEIDVAQDIRKTVQDIKKNLDSINNLANLFASKLHAVTPALQWAQDPDKIFLNVKYAHRFDSPGCLDVRDEKVTYSNNTITYSSIGEQAGTPIRFELDLELFDDVDPKGCTHYSSSVGRMTIQCGKAKEKSAWPRLLKNNKTHTGTVGTWWEMKSKYEDRMKKLEEKMEESESEEKALDRKMEESKKKRKLRKKKLKNQLKFDVEAKQSCWDSSRHIAKSCKRVSPDQPAYWWSSYQNKNDESILMLFFALIILIICGVFFLQNIVYSRFRPRVLPCDPKNNLPIERSEESLV